MARLPSSGCLGDIYAGQVIVGCKLGRGASVSRATCAPGGSVTQSTRLYAGDAARPLARAARSFAFPDARQSSQSAHTSLRSRSEQHPSGLGPALRVNEHAPAAESALLVMRWSARRASSCDSGAYCTHSILVTPQTPRLAGQCGSGAPWPVPTEEVGRERN